MAMKLDVKLQLLTFTSVVLNFIFLVVGLSVLLCGVWILFDRGTLLTPQPSAQLQTVGVGLLVIGGVVVVVSVIGCVSAVTGNRVLLLTFLGFLIVLILGQFFILLLLLLNRGVIEVKVLETLDHMIINYSGHERIEDALMDNIQHYEMCCGSMNSSDWLENRYIQNQSDPDLLPCSCLNVTRLSVNKWCDKNQPNVSVHAEGCKDKTISWLDTNIITIVVMDAGLMFIQVILCVLMAYLYRTMLRKNALKTGPLVDADHTPLDHASEDDLTNGEQNYSYIDPDDEGYVDPAHLGRLHDY
ncbi:CD82 antigen [Cheilinus undulatus]|uniref:CD82 antigen n=1 Tax=Cheilinus undulatus TaxID=241271 RepID=UPI001BD25DE3|nr:CD82 antigen [Cheilinus undulatus]